MLWYIVLLLLFLVPFWQHNPLLLFVWFHDNNDNNCVNERDWIAKEWEKQTIKERFCLLRKRSRLLWMTHFFEIFKSEPCSVSLYKDKRYLVIKKIIYLWDYKKKQKQRESERSYLLPLNVYTGYQQLVPFKGYKSH